MFVELENRRVGKWLGRDADQPAMSCHFFSITGCSRCGLARSAADDERDPEHDGSEGVR